MSRYKTLPNYAMHEDFKDAHFKPWIGYNYENGGNFGRRILLLGESIYSKVHINAPREETKEHLRHVIQKIAVDGNDRFYAKVRNLVLRGNGHSVDGFGSKKKRQDFWDSVAFYNYIQEFVGTEPRDRPKPHLWKESEAGFWEIVETLKPDVCLVLGEELWAKLPKKNDSRKITVDCFKDNASNISFRSIGESGHKTLCAHTPHPAYPRGFKIKLIVPVAKRLFELGASSNNQ